MKTHALVSLSFVSCALLAPACSDSDGVSDGGGTATDSGTRDTDGADAAALDAGAQDLAHAMDAEVAHDCPTDHLCLSVQRDVSGARFPAGELVVIWFQLNDDGPAPVPQAGYRQPVDGTENRIDIPLSSIDAPGQEQLLCVRQCDDESRCPCVGEPQIGLALVAVLPTGSVLSHRLDVFYGAAWGALVYSETEYTAAVPRLERLFPTGVGTGIRVHQVIENSGRFDALTPAPAGSVIDLNVCVEPATTCELRLPNLT